MYILRPPAEPHPGLARYADLNMIQSLPDQKRSLTASLTCRGQIQSYTNALCSPFCSIENPLRSRMWETSYLRTPLTHLPCLQSVFDHCQYGGLRPKSTLLKHNMPNLSRLNQRCDGGHQHAAWGRIGAQWATAEETAYPHELCRVLVRDQLLELGARPLPSTLAQVSDDHVAASRVATSAQPSDPCLQWCPNSSHSCV